MKGDKTDGGMDGEGKGQLLECFQLWRKEPSRAAEAACPGMQLESEASA